MPSSSPPSPEPRIRRLEPAECLAAVPALTDVLEDCIRHGASVGFMATTPRAALEAFWRGVAQDVAAGSVHLLVAEDDTGIVGTLSVILMTKPNQPHRAELAKVLVHSRARRRGIGTALMRAAEGVAAEHGRWLLCLDTATGTDSHRLYKTLGWIEIGAYPQFAHNPDGSFCDSAFMYKRLR